MAVSAALFPTAPRLPPPSPIWFIPPAPSSVLSLSRCSTSIFPEFFALLFTPNNVPISSLWFNAEFWLLESPEICRDFEIPNSLISFLGFLPPQHIVDSHRRPRAPAVSVHRTPGLGTKWGADWGPRSDLDDGFVLPTISEQRNQLNDRLLPALIRLH
ncbi:hypothetical protein TIFTF001_036039 [Ficus carica]|uniref:Uncharacterized protein n=1 Tax=Ficus carica TaxID=3494 RepID=A0AA88E4G9_FICCA|nr:hypothetical protein TIFTF001_036039 [Ficus carica]